MLISIGFDFLFKTDIYDTEGIVQIFLKQLFRNFLFTFKFEFV